MVDDLVAVVDRAQCVGCGLCAYTCDQGAIHLERIAERVYRPFPEERHFINPREEAAGGD